MKEKEAIEILKEWVKVDRRMRDSSIESDFDKFCEEKNIAIETVLQLIEKQKAEIEKKDTIINTMQAEFERLEDLEDNTDMFKMELQKKDKIIDEMAKWISDICFYKDDYSNSCSVIQDSCYKDMECEVCIKEYFKKKVKEK